MNLSTQKRLAAALLKCGISRVRVKESKEVEEALTREDIRGLIAKGFIWKIQKKGTSRAYANHLLRQKSRGRRRGAGNKRGKDRKTKDHWISIIRAQRKLLAELRDSGTLSSQDYHLLYLRAKGGMFRTKRHLLSTLKEQGFLKAGKTPQEKS